MHAECIFIYLQNSNEFWSLYVINICWQCVPGTDTDKTWKFNLLNIYKYDIVYSTICGVLMLCYVLLCTTKQIYTQLYTVNFQFYTEREYQYSVLIPFTMKCTVYTVHNSHRVTWVSIKKFSFARKMQVHILNSNYMGYNIARLYVNRPRYIYISIYQYM